MVDLSSYRIIDYQNLVEVFGFKTLPEYLVIEGKKILYTSSEIYGYEKIEKT